MYAGDAMAALVLTALAYLGAPVEAKNAEYSTPPMGWNSYNYYSCTPTEDIIRSTAQGLIDLGLAEAGFTSVTTDCGWPSRDRDAEGRLQWNETLFPSGGKALGDYLHGLGLDFGLYSGGGYFQCGFTDIPASLGYEAIDAQSFAEWGGDSLKYDNCYPEFPDVMVDYTGAEATSPSRFQTMASELDSVDRDIAYFICQWGVGENVGEWASAIGNTWRISNDIYTGWRNIWRITNEVVPYYKHTAVGAFPDMDMLIVGLESLSLEEEKFHFGMWAINKSPLVIGAAIDATITPQQSIDVMKNKEVIAINQDSLAKQAQLVRRYTEEEWDVWAGELSDSRLVLGVANWKNDSQTVQVDLAAAGVSAADARDVWAAKDLGIISGVHTVQLAGHEMKLLILSNTTPAAALTSTGYYSASNASLVGSSNVVDCAADKCLPTNKKIGDIGSGALVAFSSVAASSSRTKLLGVDFINYDVALQTAWDWGDNTRNMTLSVNGGDAKRWAFPISGGSWYETGRLMIEVDGFVEGVNEVVFGPSDGAWAPDLVGFEVFE